MGFTEYAWSRYATTIHHAWIGDHVDAVLGQTLAHRAFDAVEKMALGRAKKVRFKGRRGIHQIGSLEGKSNRAGLRWRTDHLEWGSLAWPMISGVGHDPIVAYGLAHPIKYVRLVRRNLRGQDRYYAQLICAGIPLRKLDPQTG